MKMIMLRSDEAEKVRKSLQVAIAICSADTEDLESFVPRMEEALDLLGECELTTPISFIRTLQLEARNAGREDMHEVRRCLELIRDAGQTATGVIAERGLEALDRMKGGAA